MRTHIVTIIGILLIASTTATALFPRDVALEERRIFKVGPIRHYWITCESHSMDLDCSKYYWAFAPKKEDLQIDDIGAYRITREIRPHFKVKRNINYIVHRIVNITEDCVTFKGDNNLVEDPFCISPNRVSYVLLWEEPEPWRMSIWS